MRNIVMITLTVAGLMGSTGAFAETAPPVAELLRRIEALEARIVELERADLVPAAVVEAAAAASPAAADSAQTLAEDVDARQQEQLVRAAFERTLIDRGGLLLPPWSLDVEPSLRYGNSSSDRIIIDGFTILPVLVVGDIVSERVQRERIESNLALRLGLPGSLQLDLSVPFVHEELQIVTADNEENIVADQGVGDVSLGLNWQLHRSRGAMPDLLAGLTWKTNSGTSPFSVGSDEIAFGSGYQGLDGRLTAVKVVDPVVYFGGLNYTRNFATSEDIGRFDPGDSVGFNLGMALALNLNSSISLSYDQLITGHSQLDGVDIPGSDITAGILSLGGSYAGDRFAIDFSVGIGVTSDSPDLLVRTAVPLRYRLR